MCKRPRNTFTHTCSHVFWFTPSYTLSINGLLASADIWIIRWLQPASVGCTKPPPALVVFVSFLCNCCARHPDLLSLTYCCAQTATLHRLVLISPFCSTLHVQFVELFTTNGSIMPKHTQNIIQKRFKVSSSPKKLWKLVRQQST